MLRHQTAPVEYWSGIVRLDQRSTSTSRSYRLRQPSQILDAVRPSHPELDRDRDRETDHMVRLKSSSRVLEIHNSEFLIGAARTPLGLFALAAQLTAAHAVINRYINYLVRGVIHNR